MKAMLIDVTKCTGCNSCVEACTEVHGLGPKLPARKLSRDGLSSRRLSTIMRLPDARFVKKQCAHCLEPGCAAACPVGALHKTPEGPVVYDPARCMGCRYCLLSCPLEIPRYEWENRLPYVKKCDFCIDRRREGKIPACAEACPHEACVFGERDELLARAKKLLAADPGHYLQHIYGEKELGGTSFMYISDVPLAAMGWPAKVGERSATDYTWPIISKTPWVAGIVGGFLIGTYWVVQRRMKLAAEAAEEDAATTAPGTATAAGTGEKNGQVEDSSEPGAES